MPIVIVVRRIPSLELGKALAASSPCGRSFLAPRWIVEAAKQSDVRLFGLFRQNEDGCKIPGC
jgi:hypothetical protein